MLFGQQTQLQQILLNFCLHLHSPHCMFSYGIAKVRVKVFCLSLRLKLLARLEEYKVTIKKYRSYSPKIKDYVLHLLHKVKKLGI